MPAKIRLQRRGKKGRPFYHIVIADGRAPRDGRSIEKIGTYDPMTNPATIELNFEKALHWIQVGAQPTDTAKAILSYEGVMYKNHLLKGVKKGAFNEEKAEVLFKEWREAKDTKISSKASGLSEAARTDSKKRLEAETKVNEDRKAEFSKLKADAQAAIEAEAAAKSAEKAAAEAKVEAEAKAKTEEAPKAEATPETKTEEAPKAEATPETKTEEAPKVEAAPEAKTEEEAK